jgi:hypothetical protein
MYNAQPLPVDKPGLSAASTALVLLTPPCVQCTGPRHPPWWQTWQQQQPYPTTTNHKCVPAHETPTNNSSAWPSNVAHIQLNLHPVIYAQCSLPLPLQVAPPLENVASQHEARLRSITVARNTSPRAIDTTVNCYGTAYLQGLCAPPAWGATTSGTAAAGSQVRLWLGPEPLRIRACHCLACLCSTTICAPSRVRCCHDMCSVLTRVGGMQRAVTGWEAKRNRLMSGGCSLVLE